MRETRKDELTAQKVETGLVFLHMLGAGDARTYMLNEEVPAEVVKRLLAGGMARRTDSVLVDLALAAPPAMAGYGFYCHGGRREDIVRSAIVQAALVVRDQLGIERARSLLRREGISDEVAQRVLEGDPQRRRVPPAGRTQMRNAQTAEPPDAIEVVGKVA